MTDTIKNPPAFPYEGLVKTDGGIVKLTQTGMTLRDYFAAAALQGWIASCVDSIKHPAEYKGVPDNMAQDSYVLADAMLRARRQS